MGGFVDFKCAYCGYTEESIGVGHGQKPEPCLRLFRCDKCKTVGSTWVESGKPVRCGSCYEEGVPLLDDDVRVVECPKCNQKASILPRTESWD